jgi:hypothetical protein
MAATTNDTHALKQRSDGATVLLGMPEFVVGARLEVGREL